LDHLTELNGIQNQDSDDFARWSKTRLDRLIVDYLLRNGLNETAAQCSQDIGIQASFNQCDSCLEFGGFGIVCPS
jgi:macrophage erythroblast attacher